MGSEIGNIGVKFTASASGLVGAVRESVSSIDGLRQANMGTAQSAAASAAAMREAAKITREMRTPAEQYAATVSKLDGYLARGLLTQEVHARAIAKAKAAMDDATGATERGRESMTRYASAAQTTERVVNGLSTTITGISGAVRSVSEAGTAVIHLGFDIAKATAAWKAFNTVTSAFRTPEGIFGIVVGLGQTLAVIRAAEFGFHAIGIEVGGAADFASKAALAFAALKVAMASGVTGSTFAGWASSLNKTIGITRTLTGVLARMGVSAATTSAALASMGSVGSALGAVLTRIAGMSIPGFGQLAAAVYLGAKAMIASRDAAYETATSVAALNGEAQKLGVTFQDMQVQKALDAGAAREDLIKLGVALSALDATHFDNLAVAAENVSAASARAQTASTALGTTFSSAFTGLFAGVSEGVAALQNGFADLIGGITAIATPIAQVIQPFGTIIGTVVQGVLSLVGAFGSVVGVALRFGGTLLQIAASPFIVGLSNFANAIRSGMGAAFEWAAGKIASLQAWLDRLTNTLAKIPVIGAAFRSNSGGVAPSGVANPAGAAQGTADAASAARDAMNAEADEIKAVTDAIAQQERALSSAIDAAQALGKEGFDAAVAYQQQLRTLNGELESGILNETSYAAAAGRAKADFDAQVGAIRDRNKALEEDAKAAERIRDGLKSVGQKARDEIAAIEANKSLARDEKDAAIASIRSKAAAALPGGATGDPVSKFREQQKALQDAFSNGVIGQEELNRRQAAIREELDASVADFRDQQKRNAGPDRRANTAAEVNTSEGMKTFFAILRGEDAPSEKQIREAQKQTRLLEKVHEALADQEVVTL
jgi:hypothetical protein